MIYKFFDKKTPCSGFKSKSQNEQLAENFINPLSGNLKKEECIWHSKTIFGVLI